MKILLVEDDPAIRLLLERALGAEHTVEVAVDGPSALALTEQWHYDLLVLDIDIPAIDGISVCKRLRHQGYQLPILLLTAKDRVSDRVLGLDAGADDYMVKPFHVPELLARIRALLRRGRVTLPTVVTWGELRLNSAHQEICYGERALLLTPKEYGILELLLLHPQQIFSRSTIIDRLWALEETPTESAISSHIKAIRQKLRAAGASQDLIETMYGFGYRLRPAGSAVQAALGTVVPDRQAAVEETTPNSVRETADILRAELWEKFKESFVTQLALLERAVAALQTGTLTPALRQEAQQAVHKLVGSLGVYGLPQGSVLARQLENVLHPDLALDAADLQQAAQWVQALQREISQPRQRAISPQPSRPPPLRVLVVDDDIALTTQLQAGATRRSLHLTIAPDPAAVQQALGDRHQPDVILLNLDLAPSDEGGQSWLTTLRQHAQRPVLVLTGGDNLGDRVAAVRLGAQAWLPKPVTPEHIFQAIARALPSQALPMGNILAVDDDPAILHQLSRVLSPWGLQVITLPEPERFWQVLTSTAPDLLLLDIEMPGFNGLELCQVVRHDSKWGNLPILFLTAHQEPDMVAQAFAAGGDDYIRKPILEPELVARVLNRLAGRQHRAVGR